MSKGMSNGGGLKAPVNLVSDEVVWEITRCLVEPSTIEYPVYYLIKEVGDKKATDPIWGVVIINDMVEWRMFELHFNEREYYYEVMPKHEYDTYVKFFRALSEWPARCFYKRKKDYEDHSKKS